MALEGESINKVVVEVVVLSLAPLNSLAEATATRQGYFRFQRTFPASRADFASNESCKSFLLQKLLPQTPIPEAFFNGDGCDMADKISRIMLRDDEHKDRVFLYVVVDGVHCWYRTMKSSWLDEEDESLNFILVVMRGKSSKLSLSTALRKMRIENGGKRSNLVCPICLIKYSSSESEVVGLRCSHVYHSSCIEHWLTRSLNCPLCRSPVTFD